MHRLFSNTQLVITQQRNSTGVSLLLSFCQRAPPTLLQQPDGHSPAHSHPLPLSAPLALSIRRGTGPELENTRTPEWVLKWRPTVTLPSQRRRDSSRPFPFVRRPQAEASFFGHSRILLPSLLKSLTIKKIF